MLFNTSLEIDVLANDTDADGDLLTIVAAQSDFGDVLIQGGKLIFTPLADYFGDVAINYSIDDGFGVLDSARVNVNVFVNTAPITIDDSAATDDETPILIDVLANDYDDEGNSFSLVSVTSADIGAVLEDQQIRFTPTTGFAGAVQITYMVEDIYGAQREGILTITVTPAVEVVRVRNTNENSSGGSLNIYLFAMLCMGAWYRRFTGRRYLNNTKPQTFKKFSDYE